MLSREVDGEYVHLLILKEKTMWHNWVNGLLGLWVLISPFLGFTAEGMTTNLVVVGILAIVVSVWGAVSLQTYRENEHRHAQA